MVVMAVFDACLIELKQTNTIAYILFLRLRPKSQQMRNLLALFLIPALCVSARAQGNSAGDFKKLTLEELMDLNVTSVSKRPEALSRTAAAITVITSEDLR